MILYKYFQPQYGCDVIKDLRIKVSGAQNFNDPYELLPTVLEVSSKEINREVFKNDDYLQYLHQLATEEGKTEQALDVFKSEMKNPNRREAFCDNIARNLPEKLRIKCKELRDSSSKTALITCFCGIPSQGDKETLMWAHYALSQKGIRIAFDSDYIRINGTSLFEMEYQAERVKLNPLDYWRDGLPSLDRVFRKVLRVKSNDWSYEQEQRWLVAPRLCVNDGGIIFIPINPQAVLGIDCGINCEAHTIATIKNLVESRIRRTVPIRRAETDDHSFKLKYREC